MKKTMMHEVGHSVGLADAGGGCGSQSSVMNTFCDINEEGSGLPAEPSACDRDWAQATGTCGEPDPPPTCGEECGGDPDCIQCECNGGDWLWVYGEPGGYSCESPILVNLRNNTAQYHLTSLADGVRFDINADGRTEQISWTSKDSPVAFLAMDRNGNGSIDTGAELFGNYTRKRDGTRARNGFIALAELEDPIHADGAITPADSAYASLLLWTDANHDGQSSPSELMSFGAGWNCLDRHLLRHASSQGPARQPLPIRGVGVNS